MCAESSQRQELIQEYQQCTKCRWYDRQYKYQCKVYICSAHLHTRDCIHADPTLGQQHLITIDASAMQRRIRYEYQLIKETSPIGNEGQYGNNYQRLKSKPQILSKAA
jgi:hypothetical protein